MLINDRQDGAGDQVPLVIDTEWQYWLDVGDTLVALTARAEFLVPVVLNRYAVERGDGIQRLLGQLGLTIGGEADFGLLIQPEHSPRTPEKPH